MNIYSIETLKTPNIPLKNFSTHPNSTMKIVLEQHKSRT